MGKLVGTMRMQQMSRVKTLGVGGPDRVLTLVIIIQPASGSG